MPVWLRQIIHSEFAANVGKLFAGKGLAFAISLGSAPIISRLYSPEDYGVIGVFLSIAAIGSTFASMRYEGSIVLPDNDRAARSLCQGALTLTLCFSLLAVCVVALASKFLSANQFVSKLDVYIWFLPVVIALMAAMRIGNGWLTRKKDFVRIAKGDISAAVVNSGIRIASGIAWGSSVIGLLLGNLVGTVSKLLISFPETKHALTNEHQEREHRMALLSQYTEFPKFSMPADIVRNLSQNLPVLLFGFMYSPAVAGLFYMANRLIMAPIELMLQAFRGVYLQKVAADKNAGTPLKPTYIKAIKALALMGLLPALLLHLWGQEVLIIVLGKEWADAGAFAEIMAPLLFSFWISSPAAMTLVVLRKQKFWLYTQLLIMVCQFTVFFVAHSQGHSANWALWGFVGVQVSVNLLMKIFVYHHLNALRIQSD